MGAAVVEAGQCLRIEQQLTQHLWSLVGSDDIPAQGAVELPQQVVCTIAETEPVVKGQTAASSYKPAILDNGVRIMVPPFINQGEKVVVGTAEANYVERAK